MPEYDYECGACGAISEIRHSMHEKPRKKCPKCGKMQLERLVGTGIHVYTNPGITTLGKLAEINSKKQGKEVTAKRSEGIIAQREQRREQAELCKLAKLTPEQKTRYIMDGEI